LTEQSKLIELFLVKLTVPCCYSFNSFSQD